MTSRSSGWATAVSLPRRPTLLGGADAIDPFEDLLRAAPRLYQALPCHLARAGDLRALELVCQEYSDADGFASAPAVDRRANG